MSAAIRGLRHFVSVLRGRVQLQYPLLCTHCKNFRSVLNPDEAVIYDAHKKLLCPCGGTLLTAVR